MRHDGLDSISLIYKVKVFAIAASISSLVVVAVFAQENVLGPPEALQFPFEAAANAPRSVPISVVRAEVERVANTLLCKELMEQDDRPIPDDFDDDDCEPAFAEMVRSREGEIKWAENAKPTECGLNCFGHPFMTQTQSVSQPNLRQAKLFGHLEFEADVPGPTNRSIFYFLDVTFTCAAQDGTRNGVFRTKVNVGQPVIGDPGLLETIVDLVVLPAQLSNRIEQGIQQRLNRSSAVGVTQTGGPCLSTGAFRDQDGKFDAATFDPAGPQAGTARGVLSGLIAPGDRATIRFHKLTRKSLPIHIDASHAHPGDPAAGFFSIFINGKAVTFPSLGISGGGGIQLPPQGGTVDLNFCRTIDLKDRDRLQLIFSNDLGGSAWSQFSRTLKFGDGSLHAITTGRTIIVPGSQGIPDPVTGVSNSAKPRPEVLHEFELAFTVTFIPGPNEVVASSPTPSGGAEPGSVAVGPGSQPSVAVDASLPTPAPCREI